jgi:arrestin-related trafficking adapter 1
VGGEELNNRRVLPITPRPITCRKICFDIHRFYPNLWRKLPNYFCGPSAGHTAAVMFYVLTFQRQSTYMYASAPISLLLVLINMAPGLLAEWPMKLTQKRNSSGKKTKPKRAAASKLPDLNHKYPRGEAFMLKIEIESPPLVSYGPPDYSTGALLSGILSLIPHIPPANLDQRSFGVSKLEMRLVMEIVTQRPIGLDCLACSTTTKVLNTWTFIATPRMMLYRLEPALYKFPFAFLFPGDFPASTQSSLATLSYHLIAEATSYSRTTSSPQLPGSPNGITGLNPVKVSHALHLSRSIPASIEPRISTHRMFPPTDVTAVITLPPVIHPGSNDHSLDITLSELQQPDAKLRWSLRRLSWRIDEISKVASTPCAQHAHKIPGGDREGKAILYEHVRTIGAGEMKDGWKMDYLSGKVVCVLHVGTAPNAMTACDVVAPSGIHVSHQIVIECIISQEILNVHVGPAKKGVQYIPTGNARVLRMSFPIVVTEQGGMGIAWDQEIPPRYEDVASNSPPSFSHRVEGPSTREQCRNLVQCGDSTRELETVEGVRCANSRTPMPFSRHAVSDPIEVMESVEPVRRCQPRSPKPSFWRRSISEFAFSRLSRAYSDDSTRTY